MVSLLKIPPKYMSIEEVLEISENSAELSPPLSEIIAEANNILILIGHGVKTDLALAIIEKCGYKAGQIVLFGEDMLLKEKYSHKILNINPHNLDDYKYFGVTNGKTPILLHKAVLEHDGAIVIADTAYDDLSGFVGAPTLIFPGLAADKSAENLLLKGLAFDLLVKTDLCKCGVTKGNPIDKEIKEAVVTASAATVWFGINLISKGGKIYGATAGDMLFSYVLAQKIFDEYNAFEISRLFDGIELDISDISLQKSIKYIEMASEGLMKGGRLLITANNMKDFGSEAFREFFNMPSKEDIFHNIGVKNFRDPYDAFTLKKLCSQYHIAIISKLEDADVIQCGMNILRGEKPEEFLKNCSNIGKIADATRFTTSE